MVLSPVRLVKDVDINQGGFSISMVSLQQRYIYCSISCQFSCNYTSDLGTSWTDLSKVDGSVDTARQDPVLVNA